ncbi:MAG: amidohydrolase family protein [Phycisphaeraceae bacterium]|nr:amidohydrolase family protein [Phycisphaeraceae bacterium]
MLSTDSTVSASPGHATHRAPAVRADGAARAMIGILLAVAGLLLPPAVVRDACAASERVIVLRQATILVGDGTALEGGTVVIRDGRIDGVFASGAVGDLPRGATVIDIAGLVLTPGLIDANALVEPANLLPRSQEGRMNPMQTMFLQTHDPANCAACDGTISCAFAAVHDELDDGIICPVCGWPGSIFEHLIGDLASGVRPGLVLSETSEEIVPHIRIADAINLRGTDFARLLRGGVTTVFAAPDPSVVIGPAGAVVRTAGPIRQRFVQETSAVTAVVGSDPFRGAVRKGPPSRFNLSIRSRRPSTRMGLTWVMRKAFYEARAFERGEPLTGGADTPSEPALRALGDVLRGEVPLRMQAREQHDILSALRLAQEFDLRFTLLEGVEAHKCLDEIRAAAMPVVFGPIEWSPRGPGMRAAESRGARLGTIVRLFEAGIETALSARDLREEDGLARQMMHAVRAGLSPENALRATTSIPARVLGIDDRFGTVAAGKDADLVVWNAAPHEAGARPMLILIGGRIVLDERPPAVADSAAPGAAPGAAPAEEPAPSRTPRRRPAA